MRGRRAGFLRASGIGAAGLAAAVAVFTFAGALTRDIEVATTRSYLGRLTPADDPDVNVLPAGAAVASLLVARGQEVRAGQTLATYDVDAMRAERHRLRAERAAAAVLRECLMGALGGAREPGAARPDALAGLAEAERLQAEAALARCRGEREAAEAQAARLDAAVTAVAGELRAVRRELALLQSAAARQGGPAAPDAAGPPAAGGGESPAYPQERAVGTTGAGGVGPPGAGLLTRAVALLGAQRRLTARLAALQAEVRGARARAAMSRAERIADLTLRIGALTERIGRIDAALLAPRLHAARAGTVVRLRQVPPGHVHDEDIPLVETQDLAAQGFQAAFVAPLDEAPRLTVGRPVTVRLIGFDSRVPPLSARIGSSLPQDMSSGAGGARLEVMVALSLAAQKFLTDPAHGIALRGGETAAMIEITQTPRRLDAVARAALARALAAFAPGPASARPPPLPWHGAAETAPHATGARPLPGAEAVAPPP